MVFQLNDDFFLWLISFCDRSVNQTSVEITFKSVLGNYEGNDLSLSSSMNKEN